MDYEEMKEWLDNIVRMNDKCRSTEWLNSSVNVSMYSPTIIVNKGIDIIADVMGFRLKETRDEKYNQSTYSFEYGGVHFFQTFPAGFQLGGNNIDGTD